MRVVPLILKKFLFYALTLLLVSLFSFSLFALSPGDTATLIARQRLGGELPPPQVIEGVKRELDLDVPLHKLYLKWVSNYLKGDWGRSFLTGEPVFKLIMKSLSKTFHLALLTFAISFPTALLTGMISALRSGGRTDTLLLFILSLLDSIPTFFLGLTLMMLLGVRAKVFKITLSGAILPALTLSASYMATTSRIARNSIIRVLQERFVLTAKAKGLPRKQIFIRHVLRNALIPIVTYGGLEFAWLLQGSAVVERLFGWPGIGNLTVEAALSKDLPLLQGCITTMGAVFIGINMLTDLIYAIINPEVMKLHADAS